MILIVDSGSTKTDWIAIDNLANKLFSTQTLGLNPTMLSSEILKERIKNNFELYNNRDKVEKIYFYSAGLGVDSTKQRIIKVFKSIFKNSNYYVKEDTYAAVYSVVDEGVPAIVNILGTGSNCTYYDGNDIFQKVNSLGFILMDYASGNYYGKYLIRAYYFNKMPKKLREEFNEKFDLSANTIKENLYRKENPNTYLASFAKFIIDNKSDSYFKDIIEKGLRRFIEYQIMQFDNYKSVDIHYVGSIGHYLKEEITKVGKEYDLKTSKFVKKPIEGLVDYHKRLLINN